MTVANSDLEFESRSSSWFRSSRRSQIKMLCWEGSRAGAKSREAPTRTSARALPHLTRRTSRCDAAMNRDERQNDSTQHHRGVTAVAVHGARRGVVAMANRGTPKTTPCMPCVATPRAHGDTRRTWRSGHGVRRQRSAFGGSTSRRWRVTRRARRREGPRRSWSRPLSWPGSRS